MAQKIYLTRHGQIFQNVLYKLTHENPHDIYNRFYNMGHFEEGFLRKHRIPLSMISRLTDENYSRDSQCPGLYNLTMRGIHEARTLGEYLKRMVDDKDKIVFITSEEPRTEQTASTIAIALGILGSAKFYSSLTLGEVEPLEFVPPKEVSEDMEPASDIGARAYAELEQSCNFHRDKDIIAVLHGNLNYCIVNYLNGFNFKETVMDNCGLRTITRYYDGSSSVGVYHPLEALIDEMKHMVTAGKSSIPPCPIGNKISVL